MRAPPCTENRTTVRSFRRIGVPRAVRAGVGVLEAVAPALAERVAERMFMTPPRHHQPSWERAAVRSWEPFALRDGAAVVRGFRVGTGPAVLLVHGWGGRGSQLALLAPPLVESGCSAIAIDGPGHGASDTRTTTLVEFADAVGAVAVGVGARAVVAHSFGAAALAFALHRGLALEAAVLLAPASTPRAFFDLFCRALGLRPGTRDALRRRIERNVGMSMDDLEVPRLASDLDTPALVVHDRADAEVPFEAGASIAASWPGARLLATDGLGHRRILRHPRVASEIASFVVGRLWRSPGGDP
jgi:pimeloyl-ACP methyl ester carboxylesterase